MPYANRLRCPYCGHDVLTRKVRNPDNDGFYVTYRLRRHGIDGKALTGPRLDTDCTGSGTEHTRVTWKVGR